MCHLRGDAVSVRVSRQRMGNVRQASLYAKEHVVVAHHHCLVSFVVGIRVVVSHLHPEDVVLSRSALLVCVEPLVQPLQPAQHLHHFFRFHRSRFLKFLTIFSRLFLCSLVFYYYFCRDFRPHFCKWFRISSAKITTFLL